MTMLRHLALAALLVLVVSPIVAQDFQKGLAAARSGDFDIALREWLPLAEKGNANAQYNIGVLYGNGQGVPLDKSEAAKWYRLAADQGIAVAQHNLGVMYGNGEGVPQDYAEAANWFHLAADQGDADAQKELGVMYYKGEGVPLDKFEAAKWFRLAAEQGNAAAQTLFGLMYGEGEGVPQNYVKAHVWLNLGSANGDELAAKGRDLTASKMTPADISKAQAMASECLNSGYKNCGE